MAKAKKIPPPPAAEAAPAPEVLVLQQQLADLQAELDFTLKVNAELTAEVERLAPYDPQNANKPSLKSTTATFTLNGITYGFAIMKARYKGEVITPDDVLANDHLQEELVAMGSGMIKQLD